MLDDIVFHLFGFGCGVLAAMVVLCVRDKMDLARRTRPATSMAREGTLDAVFIGGPRRSSIAQLVLILAAGGIGIVAVQFAPCCVFGSLMRGDESHGLG